MARVKYIRTLIYVPQPEHMRVAVPNLPELFWVKGRDLPKENHWHGAFVMARAPHMEGVWEPKKRAITKFTITNDNHVWSYWDKLSGRVVATGVYKSAARTAQVLDERWHYTYRDGNSLDKRLMQIRMTLVEDLAEHNEVIDLYDKEYTLDLSNTVSAKACWNAGIKATPTLKKNSA